jgi:hypothetical protein
MMKKTTMTIGLSRRGVADFNGRAAFGRRGHHRRTKKQPTD